MHDFDLYRIDGHALSIFASVCETGSVSRTAEIFDLNQSTISHTIDKLRGAVKDPLFVKSGRGITPTEKALALLPRVQRILAEFEGLLTPGEYDPAHDSRPVTIAIPTPALLEDMKMMRARLLAASPGRVLSIRRLLPRERVTELLTEEDVDLVVAMSGFRYPNTLNHCPYGADSFAVFYDPACRDAPRTVEEYCDAPHGLVSIGGRLKSDVDRVLAEMGLRRKIALSSPTASMLGDFIKGTDVIITMPSRLAKTSYHDLSHCPPPLPLGGVTYDLVWHRRYEHSGRNIWLREMLLDIAARLYA